MTDYHHGTFYQKRLHLVLAKNDDLREYYILHGSNWLGQLLQSVGKAITSQVDRKATMTERKEKLAEFHAYVKDLEKQDISKKDPAFGAMVSLAAMIGAMADEMNCRTQDVSVLFSPANQHSLNEAVEWGSQRGPMVRNAAWHAAARAKFAAKEAAAAAAEAAKETSTATATAPRRRSTMTMMMSDEEEEEEEAPAKPRVPNVPAKRGYAAAAAARKPAAKAVAARAAAVAAAASTHKPAARLAAVKKTGRGGVGAKAAGGVAATPLTTGKRGGIRKKLLHKKQLLQLQKMRERKQQLLQLKQQGKAAATKLAGALSTSSPSLFECGECGEKLRPAARVRHMKRHEQQKKEEEKEQGEKRAPEVDDSNGGAGEDQNKELTLNEFGLEEEADEMDETKKDVMMQQDESMHSEMDAVVNHDGDVDDVEQWLTPAMTQPVTCFKCDRECSGFKTLSAHIYSSRHAIASDLHVFKCTGCDKEFRSYRGLIGHIHIVMRRKEIGCKGRMIYLEQQLRAAVAEGGVPEIPEPEQEENAEMVIPKEEKMEKMD